MSLYELAKTLTNISAITDIISNASRVKNDPAYTDEEKADASKAEKLGKKKIAQENAKGGVVTKMYNGGMAHGKTHMYLGGSSSVKDNAGLRALKKASPEAYMKIKGRSG